MTSCLARILPSLIVTGITETQGPGTRGTQATSWSQVQMGVQKPHPRGPWAPVPCAARMRQTPSHALCGAPLPRMGNRDTSSGRTEGGRAPASSGPCNAPTSGLLAGYLFQRLAPTLSSTLGPRPTLCYCVARLAGPLVTHSACTLVLPPGVCAQSPRRCLLRCHSELAATQTPSREAWLGALSGAGQLTPPPLPCSPH